MLEVIITRALAALSLSSGLVLRRFVRSGERTSACESREGEGEEGESGEGEGKESGSGQGSGEGVRII